MFSANYPASHTLEGDARSIVPALLAAVQAIKADASDTGIRAQIARDKAAYRKGWRDGTRCGWLAGLCGEKFGLEASKPGQMNSFT